MATWVQPRGLEECGSGRRLSKAEQGHHTEEGAQKIAAEITEPLFWLVEKAHGLANKL